MLPHEHFLVAVIPVVGYVLIRDRALPSRQLLFVVFVGSQFPDMVDKPLAYQLGVIPTGRVFMHSLPFALPICLVVLTYSWATDRLQLGVVFAFAYLSHLFTDNYRALLGLGSDQHIPSDLLWPFLPAVARPGMPFWVGPHSIGLHLWTLVSVAVLAVTSYLLVKDVRKQYARSVTHD